MNIYQTCQKLVPLQSNEQGRMLSNTYCQRKLGHDGKCSLKRDATSGAETRPSTK